ncbi:MAG: hypothetical protein LDL44_12775 [Caenispirillum sp.]|nr:hypothetical protein [Caenispirillum sp.]
MRILLGTLLACAALTAGADCVLPLPEKNSTVADYLRQINRGAEGSVTAQAHTALFDLVEYTPMGCSDAEPDDAYSRFRIVAANRDEKNCAWLKLGIVPPGAPPSRAPTLVLCAPATTRVGGWACRFGKP